MEKIVDDPKAGFFFAAVLNTLIGCQGFSQLVVPYESTCGCPAYKLALQGYQDVIKLDEFLEGINIQTDLNWFLRKLLEVNHSCLAHRKESCEEKCIFHHFFCLVANSRFTCEFGHVFETRTNESYLPIFELDIAKYFPRLPELVKTTLKPGESLVCPYSNKMVSLYSLSSKFKCLNCTRESCNQSIFLEKLPKTLVFTVKYSKFLKELEILRNFASFPTSFSSVELFTSENSCNFSLVGYLLEKNKKFMSLSFSPQRKTWVFVSDNQKSEDSHFESIAKCVLSCFSIAAVIYSVNSNTYTSINDQMWLQIENKVINKYTLGGRIPGILKKSYRNRFWTCSSCRHFNFDVKICKCSGKFSVEQLGWICLCLKRSGTAHCECGVSLSMCFGCNSNYVKGKNNQFPLHCNECENWFCEICKKFNKLFYPICSFCSNPNMNFVENLKKLRSV